MVAYSVTAWSEGSVTDGDRSVFMRNDWMGSEASCTRWISSSLVAVSNGRFWRTAAGATSCRRTRQEDNIVSGRTRLTTEVHVRGMKYGISFVTFFPTKSRGRAEGVVPSHFSRPSRPENYI